MKIAIILPYFNEEIGLKLLKNTQEELAKRGVKKPLVYRVPGALEIPFAAQKIIKKLHPDAIIALGVVIRGETAHFDLVTKTTYKALIDLQLKHETPIVMEILACENTKQARARITKGKEAAEAAIAMIELKI